MKHIDDEMDFLKRLVVMLEKQLGSDTEIVLHDLTKPYDSTIVAIANGEISGRKIGDSGTNLGLEVLRGTVENGDRFNYITNTKNGKILRSSSMYIQDENKKVIGSLCINTDITESLKFEKYLHDKNGVPLVDNEAETDSQNEIFANNVGEILEYLLLEAQKKIGTPAPSMTKEEKVRFIKYLDDRGAFLITKSSEKIGAFLNISKYTLYQYLDHARKENG